MNRKTTKVSSKTWKKNRNVAQNYSTNEVSNYNGNILSQLKRTNDEFIQYIEGNDSINSSFDENEELDKWESLVHAPNSAIWTINRQKNIDFTEVEPQYTLKTYKNHDENSPIIQEPMSAKIQPKQTEYQCLQRQLPSYFQQLLLNLILNI